MWKQIATRYNEIHPTCTVSRTYEKLRNHWKRISADIKVFESHYLTVESTAGNIKGRKDIFADALQKYQAKRHKPFRHHKTFKKV